MNTCPSCLLGCGITVSVVCRCENRSLSKLHNKDEANKNHAYEHACCTVGLSLYSWGGCVVDKMFEKCVNKRKPTSTSEQDSFSIEGQPQGGKKEKEKNHEIPCWKNVCEKVWAVFFHTHFHCQFVRRDTLSVQAIHEADTAPPSPPPPKATCKFGVGMCATSMLKC